MWWRKSCKIELTNLKKLKHKLSGKMAFATAQFSLSQITEDFVYKQLKTLNSKKSSGLPDIPIRLVKDGAEALVRRLTLLLSRSINEVTLPVDWKHAIVTPVHKAGSKSDPSNFRRPNSVLPVFSKILERAVHRMAYTYLQEHRLLSHLQSGFRPLHSTSTCHTHVTNTVSFCDVLYSTIGFKLLHILVTFS